MKKIKLFLWYPLYLKLQRDKYDHYSHHKLIFVVKRHNLYRGIYCASSCEVTLILDTYKLNIAY